ncbi:unnamed protein product [Cylindrotheca closterium]|uniref:DUF6824 domain-containing protein n=1 Tax=Cylindrotheca closterium TaxID=2856 RepID=A0AAD2CSI1_9STRA|nr:unnamed protein product [Cylindrotheca closterium]
MTSNPEPMASNPEPEPNPDYDIRPGQESASRQHPGNKNFLELVKASYEDYYRAGRAGKNAEGSEKGRIEFSIVKAVHDKGGRFLTKDDNGNLVPMTVREAMIKTRAALIGLHFRRRRVAAAKAAAKTASHAATDTRTQATGSTSHISLMAVETSQEEELEAYCRNQNMSSEEYLEYLDSTKLEEDVATVKSNSDRSAIASVLSNMSLTFDELKDMVDKIECVTDMELPGNNFYTGSIMNSLPYGRGLMTYKNGRIASGDWVMGKLHGQAFVLHEDGGYYYGLYSEDKEVGCGVRYHTDGSTFVASVANAASSNLTRIDRLPDMNKLAFCTNMELQEGKRYTGSTKFDESTMSYVPHGRGMQMIDKRGQLISGDWYNGKVDGQAFVCYGNGVNGGFFFGTYAGSRRVGYGVRYYADGSKHVGPYSNDKPNGRGKRTYKDGSSEDGDFTDGKLDGYVVKTSRDKIQTVWYYKNGIKRKEWTEKVSRERKDGDVAEASPTKRHKTGTSFI